MPFGGYKDFDECVRKNSDKGNPKAYCGKIQHAVEAIELEMNKPTLTEFNAVEQLGEITAWEDTESGGLRARIRVIRAGLSKNNRNYRVSALKKAAKEGIFNDLKMFNGHSKDVPLKRRNEDFVAYLDETAFEEESQSLVGWANFVDRPFAERVRAAKKHIGVSIDSLLRGTRHPQPTGRALEDIHEFAQPRSVDFVLFPAAGGEILAWESEGDEQVDWAAVEAEAASLSEEDLKKNLPTLWAKWHPETKAPGLGVHGHEATDDDEDDEEEGTKKTKKKVSKKDYFASKEDVDKYVQEALTAHEQERKLIADKQEAAAELVRQAFAQSGLPPATRSRVMLGFEGVEEFDEKKVTKAITDAKEELKAVGAGPRITDMGPSGIPGGDKQPVKVFAAHESVRGSFGYVAPTAKADDKKKE